MFKYLIKFIFIFNILIYLIIPINNLNLKEERQYLIECKDPLFNLNKWECKINKEVEEEGGEENYLINIINNLKNISKEEREEEKNNLIKLNSVDPLELYYSFKVNRSNGQLFISAILRWEFTSTKFFNFYKIFLYIEEINKNRRIIDITAISSLNNSSIGNLQRLKIILQLDDLFKFGNSYNIKIISLPLLQHHQQLIKSKNEDLNENSSFFNLTNIEEEGIYAFTDKQINFDSLPEELNSNICHQKLNDNNVDDLKEWKKRQSFASRWTGALRSVVFYPLHSAINISFFGAPPSFCINLYKIQLWLLNSLLQEKIVENLLNEGPGIFIGFVEFRDLLSSDTRLKYKIRIIPIERREKDGNCICELNNKCGCVQVISDWFTMPNASTSSITFNHEPIQETISLLNTSKNEILKLNEEKTNSLFLLILICLFLALTFILLTFAFLLFILKKIGWTKGKRQSFIIIRKPKNEHNILTTSKKYNNSGVPLLNGNVSGGVYSILLANAQPTKSADLERFARLLVKNGVRIFYDRWDKTAIERNLLLWVQQATTKADKAVFFWDKRAEQLITPNNETIKTTTSISCNSSFILDHVFCALHQQMDPEKTIFVNWDESAINEKPLGCVGENRPFLFSRDLALIYTALNIPASELDIQKFARLPSSSLITSLTTPSLTICVPIKTNSKLKEIKQIEKDKGNNLNNKEEKEEENIFLLPNNEECENKGNKELLNFKVK
uniref:ILCR1 Ig-like domain-containing protein n=1 Tax=Meloidogyne enterolobii TaxID=390850 RepID=A0A6V7U6J9_MELEN|nr:unnamed protein product [Meloidogyne enterolobii]